MTRETVNYKLPTDDDRNMPWEEHGYDHNVVDHSDRIVKCKRCGKMATSEEKLKKTVCNPGRDRGDHGQ